MTCELIDSHCHLTSDALLNQAPAVIDRAKAAGVGSIVTIATDLADAEQALELSRQHSGVHVVCGIHPHEAAKAPANWDAALIEWVRRDDVIGVGEMGLDYHYDFSDRRSQRAVFIRQLEIAQEIGKPIVVHCREAHGDTLQALSGCGRNRKVVIHCFTGSQAEAEEILEQGYWISLTGAATFKRSDELRRVAAMVPDDRLMIETDSPYLSPEPVRNVRPNEPAHLVHIAACIAKSRGVTVDELGAMCAANTRRFFSLPGP